MQNELLYSDKVTKERYSIDISWACIFICFGLQSDFYDDLYSSHCCISILKRRSCIIVILLRTRIDSIVEECGMAAIGKIPSHLSTILCMLERMHYHNSYHCIHSWYIHRISGCIRYL